MKKTVSSALPIFLLGLFSQTQVRVIAFMDISELICYIVGPYFFIQDLPYLKKHGFGKFLFVWFLCMIGCAISSWANQSPFPSVIRGMGVPVAVFCIACTFHHFLMRDFKSFKWFFIGFALSSVMSIFIFQRGTSRAVGGEILEGSAATENTISYSLFWMSQIATWTMLPIQMRYLKTPKWYSIVLAVFLIFFGFFSAGSRSSLGVLMFTLLLVFAAGRKLASLNFVKKHFVLIVVLMLAFVPVASSVYKYCAVHNYLGDKAYEKYVSQSKRGSDALSLLMGGRGPFFVGAFACLDKPIVGHGPWAVDTEGYYVEWLSKYGDQDDYEDAFKRREWGLAHGGIFFIPSHSFVVGFWLWYGVLGLVCMLYVGWLYVTTLKNNLGAIPELYGAFAFYLPSILWAWLFSPFGGRTNATFMMVLCLFARAVARNKFQYRSEMIGGFR